MSGRRLKVFTWRLVLLGLLWWVLTAGEPSSWWFGAPLVCLTAAWRLDEAAAVSGRFRPWRLIFFVPYFLWRSFTGSFDVAWRALHWRLPIVPAMHPFTFRLPPQSPARVVFANCINLVPGTLAAAWDGDELQIHLMVAGPGPVQQLRQLEDRVGLLFGYRLTPDEGSEEP